MPTTNSWNSNIPVEISKGGTNATTMATSSGIVKYDGTRLVTSATAKLDASNRMTNTSQPAFLSKLVNPINNATGDSASVTITYDTAIFDNGANFGGQLFTAPITGRYQLNSCTFLSGLLIAHTTGFVNFGTSNGSYRYAENGPYLCRTGGNNLGYSGAILCDMDAGDTAGVSLAVSGGTKVVNILGTATSEASTFSGFLVC